MSKRGIPRRNFLQYGLAAAATSPWLLGQTREAEAHPKQDRLSRDAIFCNVAVIGGGAAGIHSAYQLAKLPVSNPDSNVYVFEKENRLGGRIFDVALDPSKPDLVFGTGALRVMETQNYVLKLAQDLGITLEAAPWRDDLISARGFFAFTSDELNQQAYPLVTKEFLEGGGFDTEAALYDQLRFGPERQNIATYPDFRSYVRAVVGPQGYRFLTEMFRFRADFEATLDARAYLDYFDEEWDVCCTPFYPTGGMSEFIKRMAADAVRNGAKIHLAEPAQSISTQSGDHRYLILTPKYAVSAKKLILASEAATLSHIQGNIIEDITAQPQFQDLVGIEVATVAQRWPRAWWLESGYPGKEIRRAWTTEQSLNALEIPIAPYVADQLVTRTVYTDDINGVAFWKTAASRGIAHVEGEIMRGLKYLFPKANIPPALNTHVQVWPAGWYWLKGGSRFTNANIATWAISPLDNHKEVSLVGESYNPQRSGWSDGAYKSSINTLNKRYGFDIAIPSTAPQLAAFANSREQMASRRAHAPHSSR